MRRAARSNAERAREFQRAAVYLKHAKGALSKGHGILTYDDAVNALFGRAAVEREAAERFAETITKAVAKASGRAA